MKPFFALLPAVLLTACNTSVDDGVVDVAIIGAKEDPFDQGLHLSLAGQTVRAAVAQGLVRVDANGDIVPALAERWIVTDDGASYIFRIREFDLPNGERLTAQSVRDSLAATVRGLSGTSLGFDLAKIHDIRAMTGRVIEIRLSRPMPGFLQLLAQPELGLVLDDTAIGPMSLSRDGDVAVLDAMEPELRGLPAQPGWGEDLREVRVYGAEARQATEGFAQNRFDVVLGGRLSWLPLADTSPLSRGTIRLDSAIGLFGLDVRQPRGLLETAQNREALAMAIDRDSLLKAFNIGGWLPSTRIVPSSVAGDTDTVGERWSRLTLDQRRVAARARVAQWRAASGKNPAVSIWLPDGPGSDLLFTALARDFATVGVSATRAEARDGADLAQRDRVARYADPRWFLNQFNCRVSGTVCSSDADYLVNLALDARNASEEASYLAEAESTLTATNLYIPLGAPIRWSLVRADVDGFVENSWNVHPLFPLSRAPI